MKTLAKILGLAGLVMFFFGIVSFVLTQVKSIFFMIHIYAGLALLLVYFIILFRGSKQFLGLMLLVILTILGIIVSGGQDLGIYFLIVPCAVIFVTFLLFNFESLTIMNRLPFLFLPAVIGALGVVFRQKLHLGEQYFLLISGFGLIVIIIQFLMNMKFIREGVLGKSTKYAVNVLVYSVLFLFIVVVLNLLGANLDWKKDFTENKINMLSEQSVKIIKDLKSELKIIAFFAEKNRMKEPLKEMLDRYTSESKMVKVEFIDPDLKPQSAELYKARDGNIAVVYGEEKTVINDISEESLTGAIIKVTKTLKPTICLTQGHGEMKISDEEAEGMSMVAGGIKNEGYETKPLAEMIIESIPAECDMIIVAGPKIPFTARESAVIEDYLAKGGKGLFLMTPRIPNPNLPGRLTVLETGLEKLAANNGVNLGRDYVLEKHIQLFAGVTIESSVQAMEYSDHSIVKPLDGKLTLFPRGVRSVTKAKTVGNYGTVTELIKSAGQGNSWAETDIDSVFRKQKAVPDAGEITGPVPIAVAVEKNISARKEAAPSAQPDERASKKETSKSIWVGNSYFIANGYVRSSEFNYDLFLNMLSWLWGEDTKISIRPKTLKTSMLILTPEQSNIIFYVTVLAIPEIILVFGLVIWIIRRKK
jgi:ABC-type uncharacterized transport system involved in gliding motility auxiliary subunit